MGEYFNVLFNDSHVSAYRDQNKYVMDCGDDGAGDSKYDSDQTFHIYEGWKTLENSY